jgi:two-component sensor histidine kinase
MIDHDLRYVMADGPLMPQLTALVKGNEVLGRTATELLSDAYRAEVLDSYRRTLRGESTRMDIARSDRHYDVDTVPIRDGDRVTHGLIFLHDVTARKAQVAQLRAMLQEIHHRVKNNLQMISSLLNLQARQIPNEEARAAFRDTQGRVRSMALLHESLYQSDDLGRIDMRDYVDKLIAMMLRAHGPAGAGAAIRASVDRVLLPIDVAVPCGLIVNELVTNSMKHAFRDIKHGAPEVRVEMHRSGREVVITVRDNGAGFAEAFDPARDESMGLTLVRDLSDQLRGQFELANEAGARCMVTFLAPEGGGLVS